MILIWKVGTPGKEISTMVDEIAKLDSDPILGTRLTLTVGAVGALSLAIVGLWNFFVNHRRANTAEKQQSQELFVSSIKNLGSREEIIRIGAIQGLERLASESPQKWGYKVAEMLLKYIISTTSKPSYKIIYEFEPASEITAALEVWTELNENAK